jgi:hypothetical protein
VEVLMSQLAERTRSVVALAYLQKAAWIGARALRRAGHVADATRLGEWGLALLDTSSIARAAAIEPNAALVQNFRRAAMLSDVGRLPESRALFEQIASAERTSGVRGDLAIAALGYLADIALRRGDRDAASVYRDRLRASLPLGGETATYMLARIAALEGRRSEAVALLGPIAWSWEYHLRRDPDLDTLRGYPPFVALLKPPVE